MPGANGEVLTPTIDPVVALRFLFSIIFIVGLSLLAVASRRLIESRVEEQGARRALRRLVTWVVVTVIILMMGILWLERLGGLSVAVGLLAAGAAFALRDTVASVAGWVLITSGRVYRVGDRVEVGGIQGDIIGFGILRTTLMEIGNWVKGDQHTGRIVTVSNSVVFQEPVYNYTRYFRFLWDEIAIPVTFGSNIEKARALALEIANEHTTELLVEARAELQEMARHFNVAETELLPFAFLTFNDNWVELGLRYVTEARLRRRTRHHLSQRILAAFHAEPDIKFSSETMSVTIASEERRAGRRQGDDE